MSRNSNPEKPTRQVNKVKYKYFGYLHMRENLTICLFLLVSVLSIMVAGKDSLFKSSRKAKPILVNTLTKTHIGGRKLHLQSLFFWFVP